MELPNEYGFEQFEALESCADCKIYQIKNESGSGTITSYDVFPGVNLSYNDFHMRYYESEFMVQFIDKLIVMCYYTYGVSER